MKYLITPKFLALGIFLVSIMLTINSCSTCHDEEEMEQEETCLYEFDYEAGDIVGAWEPKSILNLETGETVFFEEGKGHYGFIFKYYYADSYEIRDNGETANYYVGGGRFCKDRVDGHWAVEKDTLYFKLYQETIKLPIISLRDDEMVIRDHINFADSEATMRKVN